MPVVNNKWPTSLHEVFDLTKSYFIHLIRFSQILMSKTKIGFPVIFVSTGSSCVILRGMWKENISIILFWVLSSKIE